MRPRIEQALPEPINRQLTPNTPPTPELQSQPMIDREIDEYRYPSAQRPSQNSFFSLLFERPARRRVYRQLNQNATNLVRRLSQSRLFLNSSRAQRNRNQQNSAQLAAESTSAEQPFDVPVIHNELTNPQELRASSISLPSIEPELEIAPTAPLHVSDEDGYTSDPDLGLRLETPPPAYKDILPKVSPNMRRLSERHSF